MVDYRNFANLFCVLRLAEYLPASLTPPKPVSIGLFRCVLTVFFTPVLLLALLRLGASWNRWLGWCAVLALALELAAVVLCTMLAGWRVGTR